jgi:hypothetical protein
MILWVIAVLLALVPLSKGSRWWLVAAILPFFNAMFVFLTVNLAEWLASRPGIG